MRCLSTALAMLFCITALAAIPSKPSPPRLVNDLAGVFQPMESATLERVLTDYNDSTSTQIAVVTVNDLEGMAAAEYATRIGLEWQVGSEKFDNGVVILVKPKNSNGSGEVFIAVGYGLEGAIPDARAKAIIDRIMIPRFIENDYFGAVAGACDAIMKLASGEGFKAEEDEDDLLAAVIALITILIFTVLIVYLVKNGDSGTGNFGGNGGGGTRTIYLGPTMRGGSFGGFGGRSSGGFGGFGGGSFGGGGAGGRW